MSVELVLQSWKQIAEYVGRTERTLQRWEQDFGFPVHRPSGKSRSSVMALAQEIHEWTRGKPSLLEIQGSSRLNRLKLTQAPGSPHVVHNSSDRDHQVRARANAIRKATRQERRQCELLWQEQQTLLKEAEDLVEQQRDLCKTLRQQREQRSRLSAIKKPA